MCSMQEELQGAEVREALCVCMCALVCVYVCVCVCVCVYVCVLNFASMAILYLLSLDFHN